MNRSDFQIEVKEILMQLIEEDKENLPYTLGIKDLMKHLPHSKAQIYVMLTTGELPGKKLGGRWIVPRNQFLAFVHGAKLEKDLSDEVKV